MKNLFVFSIECDKHSASMKGFLVDKALAPRTGALISMEILKRLDDSGLPYQTWLSWLDETAYKL